MTVYWKNLCLFILALMAACVLANVAEMAAGGWTEDQNFWISIGIGGIMGFLWPWRIVRFGKDPNATE